MSYRCRVDARLAAMAGIEPGPWIECNSCGTRLNISLGRPPKWLLDGRAPPRWRTTRHEDGIRADRCPACREVHADGCSAPFDDKHLDRGEPCPSKEAG